jgi:hypothetical protein
MVIEHDVLLDMMISFVSGFWHDKKPPGSVETPRRLVYRKKECIDFFCDEGGRSS